MLIFPFFLFYFVIFSIIANIKNSLKKYRVQNCDAIKVYNYLHGSFCNTCNDNFLIILKITLNASQLSF